MDPGMDQKAMEREHSLDSSCFFFGRSRSAIVGPTLPVEPPATEQHIWASEPAVLSTCPTAISSV